MAIIPGLLWPASLGVAAEQDDIVYRTLVQRVRTGDFTVDFRSLRLACIKSSHCAPRGTRDELAALGQAVKNNQAKSVVEIAERLVEKGFVNIEAHASSIKPYTDLNNPAKAKFHRDVVTALVRSIFETGDGKAKESAFEVICDREEYFVLGVLGLSYSDPAVSVNRAIGEGTHRYDRWVVQNPKTGQTVVVFFNIDAFSPTKSRVN